MGNTHGSARSQTEDHRPRPGNKRALPVFDECHNGNVREESNCVASLPKRPRALVPPSASAVSGTLSAIPRKSDIRRSASAEENRLCERFCDVDEWPSGGLRKSVEARSLETLYEESPSSPLAIQQPFPSTSTQRAIVGRTSEAPLTSSLARSSFPVSTSNPVHGFSTKISFPSRPVSTSVSLDDFPSVSGASCSNCDDPAVNRNNKKRRFSTKFLSASVSRLHLFGTKSALEQCKRASRSITSLTLFRESSKGSLTVTTKEPKFHSNSVRSLDRGSANSLSDGVWPVPFFEAIFLPEFPVRSTISEKDFFILNRIGSGAFGNVFRVSLKREPNVLFAMKKQRKSEILEKDAVQQIKDEASIHKSLSSCSFIAKFYASWQSRSELFTVLQYAMGYGDLFTLWRDYGPFCEAAVTVYAAEIALALHYIHENDIVYRDLKMENVVLDLDGHIQIVDFGFAKRLTDGDTTRTICGTLQYMAPEIARGDAYGRCVDWWSFGVLVYILLANHCPFPNSEAKTHEQLRFDGYTVPTCSAALVDFLAQLLCVNIDVRMHSFMQIRSHPFFESVNWNDIASRKVPPFEYIEKLRRCASCNSMYDRSGSEMSGSDLEENWAAFDENYEFDEDDYFRDRI